MLAHSGGLPCICATWQSVGDVISEHDLWIMAISAQIKAIIRDNLPFTNDCVQSNAFLKIYIVYLWIQDPVQDMKWHEEVCV